MAALVHNDLEASVTARKPAVGALRDRLAELGALAAAMTGSGAAVFGLFAGAEEAARARAALAPARAWCGHRSAAAVAAPRWPASRLGSAPPATGVIQYRAASRRADGAPAAPGSAGRWGVAKW